MNCCPFLGVIYSSAKLPTASHFLYHPHSAPLYRTGSYYGC